MADLIERQQAIEAMEDEHLESYGQPDRPDSDVAYDRAIDDCIGAIKSLLSPAAPVPHAPSEGTTEWQPIETAPKDGTTVLLFRRLDPWAVMGVGRWEEYHEIGGWITRGLNDPPGNLGLAHPTHWMPLPAAPGGAEPPKE